QIGFNYLGRFAAPSVTDWAESSDAPARMSGDPAMPLAHCIDINARTLDAADGATLTAVWSWAPALVAEDVVRELATRWFAVLEALVRYAEQPRAGGRSPSDIRLASLSQGEIERLEGLYPHIEDILPLSPLQQGLLFHALYDSESPDIYTVQLELELDGVLDRAALHAAARALLARHPSLRACFPRAELSHQVQVIGSQVAAQRRVFDLSRFGDARRTQRLAEVLAQDRAERFDLTVAPLLRFTLIRMAARRHKLVITNHHVLMDGWSAPVLVRELLTLYRQGADTAVLPRAVSYRDYLAWLAAQDRSTAIAAWREALSGLEDATPLAPRDAGPLTTTPEQIRLALDAPRTTALIDHARTRGLTFNTLVQTAWAVLLGRLTGRDDVVFGATVAGRPPEIVGVESIVGLFIN